MKKNLVNKLIAGLLASTMVFGMAACGSEDAPASTPASESKTESEAPAESKSEEASAPVEEGPNMDPLSITISLPTFKVDHTEPNELYDKLIEDINAYTNMDITWQWAMDYYEAEQLGLKLATGDVADVLVVGKDATFLAAAEEGLFWDLAPYYKDYDNLAVIPDATIANASYNGKLYGIPRSRTLARNGFGYRLDWLNNLGLKEPTDWESFSKMLYEFTYGDPDGNGQNDTVGLFMDQWAGAWDIMATWFGVPNTWGIDANGDLIHKSQTEEFKTALAAFRELYSLGVINNGSNGIPDFQDVQPGKARDEGLRTQLGGCGIQVLDDQRKVETYFEDQGLSTPEEPIYTLGGYVDTGLGALCYPTTGMNNMIAISTKNVKTEEQLRRVLQFLNDLNDGECVTLIDHGWEGTVYELDENGYIARYTPEQLEEKQIVLSDYSDGFNQVLAYFTAPENAAKVTTAPPTTAVQQLEQKMYKENEKYCVVNYGAPYNSAYYVEHGKDLDTMLDEARVKYITGEIDDAGLEEALKKLVVAGGETVTKEMNAAYHAAGN